MNVLSTYRRLKRQRDAGEINGFTLIELLIVIVVLGVLAAVVIFALGGITGQSITAACQADGATLTTAVAAFNAQNPGGTATPANLITGTPANNNNPYLQSMPLNLPHYAYSVIGGVVVFEASTTAATVTAWNAAPVNGATLAGGILYAGPNSATAGCAAPLG